MGERAKRETHGIDRQIFEPQRGDRRIVEMSSHRVHFFHLVWSTKHREQVILPKIRDDLYPYLGGIINKSGGRLLEIGGMPDHVHLLIEISNLDHFTSIVRNAKAGSSTWLKNKFTECQAFAWQNGYGSFSVSFSQLDPVRRYIINQEKHHRNLSYEEEYTKLLTRHEAKFDERYLFE